MALDAREFEKLGVFYLGRQYDLASRTAMDAPVLYDSRDLTTHAMCVGMTGSGKTGLCIALLEEAAIDGVPALVVDPKGDLGNLMLSFPDLDAGAFLPWIHKEDAGRYGINADELASREAEKWKTGLALWGQDGARIRRLQEAADIAIFTPGSGAGIPVSITGSFGFPGKPVVDDAELLNDRAQTTVSSLLGLLGIDADPLKSREASLLSAILAHAWKNGESLGFPEILQRIQKPPFDRVGLLDIEAFYPGKDRFALVLAINNLLASPGFALWTQGAPLDIQSLLFSSEGRPRLAVMSIAHLSEAERMFFVSLLLNEVVAWMRMQQGTTSLRAVLYMDEVFGYFPPVANPPSKKPLMTLLKQGRAFGLGVVLATQNPADLDYKGLANIGTWLVGKLQTERDKARLLDGLEGGASSFDRGWIERALGALGNRIFLMRNVHEDAPVIFESRHTLSYLSGPLTREQIRKLTPDASRPLPASPDGGMEAPSGRSQPLPLDPKIAQVFVHAPAASSLLAPMILGLASIPFSDSKRGIDQIIEKTFVVPIHDGVLAVDWKEARALDVRQEQLVKTPPAGASYAALPESATRAGSFTVWERDFARWLAASQKVTLLRSPSTGLWSKAGETEGEFRVRIRQPLREYRDALAQKLREKFNVKLAALREKLGRADAALRRETAQANDARMQTLLSVGETLLGALLGRKVLSASNVNRAASAAKGAGRAWSQAEDAGRARETLESLHAQEAALNAELASEIARLETGADAASERLESADIPPKKTGISVRLIALAWVPEDLARSL